MEENRQCRICWTSCGEKGVKISSVMSDFNLVLQGHVDTSLELFLLPEWLCICCVHQLTNAANFIKQAIQSYVELIPEEAPEEFTKEEESAPSPEENALSSEENSPSPEENAPSPEETLVNLVPEVTETVNISDDSNVKHSIPVEPELQPCDTCGKSFRSWTYAWQHVCPRKFVCDICDAGFSWKRTLRAHMRSHIVVAETVPSSSSINQDPRKRPRKDLPQKLNPIKGPLDFAALKREALRDIGGRISCTLCKGTFPTKALLESHMLIHRGMTCFICSKGRFQDRESLNHHVKGHFKRSTHRGQGSIGESRASSTTEISEPEELCTDIKVEDYLIEID